jgi:hypothetical protein
MKKALLTVVIFLSYIASQSVNAQSFSVAHDTAAGYTSTTIDVHNSVLNLSSTTSLIMAWKVTDSFVSGGWHIVGLCDNNLCYPQPTTATHESLSINPSTPMDTKVQFDGTNAPNNSFCWVTIRYWDKNSPFVIKNITYIAYKNPTGVTGVTREDDDILLYPNPARDVVNVVFDGNAGIKSVAIYNMIGKVVSAYKVAGNSAKLEIDGIPSGIYFVRLLDAQGRIVATRKFTHQ